jgi:hypothetical protein
MAHQDTRRWPSAAVSSVELAELERFSDEREGSGHPGEALNSVEALRCCCEVK